jgi:hypothetical protein
VAELEPIKPQTDSRTPAVKGKPPNAVRLRAIEAIISGMLTKRL